MGIVQEHPFLYMDTYSAPFSKVIPPLDLVEGTGSLWLLQLLVQFSLLVEDCDREVNSGEFDDDMYAERGPFNPIHQLSLAHFDKEEYATILLLEALGESFVLMRQPLSEETRQRDVTRHRPVSTMTLSREQ